MIIEENYISSNFRLEKTNSPFQTPTDSNVHIINTYFIDITDFSVISIEKPGQLIIKSCVFNRCLCSLDDQHIVNYNTQQGEFIFSRCLSEGLYAPLGVFSIDLERRSVLKNEVYLSNFENYDQTKNMVGLLMSFGEKIKISDINVTNIKAYSDILYFGTNNSESFLAFSYLKNNTVTDHSAVTFDLGYFSIFCCNFFDLSKIRSAIQLYRGNYAIISSSNLFGVTGNEIYCHTAGGYILFANCYIEGTKPSTSNIIIEKEKNSLVNAQPEIFPPFDAFLCSRALKGKELSSSLLFFIGLLD